jgi:hypothetical protein
VPASKSSRFVQDCPVTLMFEQRLVLELRSGDFDTYLPFLSCHFSLLCNEGFLKFYLCVLVHYYVL